MGRIVEVNGKARKKYKSEFTTGSGKLRRRISKTFATKREATTWLAELELAKGQGTTFQNGELLFSDWYFLWYRLFKERNLAPATKDTYIATYQHLKAYLPTVKVNELSRPILQNYFNLMAEQNAHETLRKDLTHIRMALRESVDSGTLVKNPASNLVLPKAKPTKSKEARIMTKAEYQQIETFLNEQPVEMAHLYDFVLLVISKTALRVGEALALTAPDLDLAHGVINVKHSYDSHVKQIKAPKTANGIREIPIGHDLVVKLQQWMVMHDAALKQVGIANPKQFLFLNLKGHIIQASNVNRAYQMIQAQLGFKHRYSTHTMRHYLASQLIGSGKVSMVYTSRLLGHSSTTITSLYYAGIVKDDQTRQHRAALNVIEDLA